MPDPNQTPRFGHSSCFVFDGLVVEAGFSIWWTDGEASEQAGTNSGLGSRRESKSSVGSGEQYLGMEFGAFSFVFTFGTNTLHPECCLDCV
jgi:hypothetical protein